MASILDEKLLHKVVGMTFGGDESEVAEYLSAISRRETPPLTSRLGMLYNLLKRLKRDGVELALSTTSSWGASYPMNLLDAAGLLDFFTYVWGPPRTKLSQNPMLKHVHMTPNNLWISGEQRSYGTWTQGEVTIPIGGGGSYTGVPPSSVKSFMKANFKDLGTSYAWVDGSPGANRYYDEDAGPMGLDFYCIASKTALSSNRQREGTVNDGLETVEDFNILSGFLKGPTDLAAASWLLGDDAVHVKSQAHRDWLFPSTVVSWLEANATIEVSDSSSSPGETLRPGGMLPSQSVRMEEFEVTAEGVDTGAEDRDADIVRRAE